jgi:hypothetical protein
MEERGTNLVLDVFDLLHDGRHGATTVGRSLCVSVCLSSVWTLLDRDQKKLKEGFSGGFSFCYFHWMPLASF